MLDAPPGLVRGGPNRKSPQKSDVDLQKPIFPKKVPKINFSTFVIF